MTPPGWKCPRRVGYLFPHQCSRLTPEGCPDCQNGQITDPYRMRRDRYFYSDYEYDSYDETLVGMFLGERHHDFTEADGESLINEQDDSPEFENDFSAS